MHMISDLSHKPEQCKVEMTHSAKEYCWHLLQCNCAAVDGNVTYNFCHVNDL